MALEMIDLDAFITTAKKIFLRSRITEFDPFWAQCFEHASIDSNLRAVMFLAQVGHECQGYTRFEENLNYSASGLANTWPTKYAINPKAKVKVPNAIAVAIQRKPEIIANKTYANRNGNGNEASGDGWRYRGRGEIMTTGYGNVLKVDNAFNMNGKIVSNPDLLTEPYWAHMAAAEYWRANNLNKFADKKDISGARKAINGGLIGLGDVTMYYNKISKIITL